MSADDRRPLYRQLVEESFHPRRWVRRANAVVFLLSYLFIGGLRYFAPGVFYLDVATFAVLVALVFEKVRGLDRSLLSLKDLRLLEIAPQIPAGLAVGLGVAIPLVVASGPFRIQVDFVAFLLLAWASYAEIAPVESLLQSWVWPQVLPFGLVLGQVFFAAIHPEVLYHGNVGFFLWALGAGGLFAGMTALRYFGPVRFRRYFGLTSAIVAHGTVNTVLGSVFVILGGFQFGPLSVLVLG